VLDLPEPAFDLSRSKVTTRSPRAPGTSLTFELRFAIACKIISLGARTERLLCEVAQHESTSAAATFGRVFVTREAHLNLRGLGLRIRQTPVTGDVSNAPGSDESFHAAPRRPSDGDVAAAEPEPLEAAWLSRPTMSHDWQSRRCVIRESMC